MTDQPIQTLTTDVERDLLEVIIQNLEQNKIDSDEAGKVAREFLSFLPLQDQKDLLEKLNKLSKDHRETKSLYLKYVKPYEEEERQRKLALMSEHIKNGKIEHAIAVAKEGKEIPSKN
jgi:hypothetical protein